MSENDNLERLSDIDLVQNFQENGDREFISLLYQRHLDALLSMAIIILKDRTNAEDMVQSTFIIVLNKISSFQCLYEKGVKAWLMTLLINACKMSQRDEGRRQRREKIASEEKVISDPNEPIEQDKRIQRLLQEMDSLPEMYRVPLHMHYQQNMPFKEMSSILSVPEKTLHTRSRRGIAKLREQLLKAGVTASAVFIASVLKSKPMEAASSLLREGLVSLAQQSASLSQKVAVVQGGASVGGSAWPSSLSLLSLKGITACLFIALGTYGGIHFFSSEEPLPSEILTSEDITSQDVTSQHPLNIHCSFDAPEISSELKSILVPGQDFNFKYIADGGLNNSGAIEGQNDAASLLVEIAKGSLPLKITYRLRYKEGLGPSALNSDSHWLKYESFAWMVSYPKNLEAISEDESVWWVTFETYFTRNLTITYLSDDVKRTLIGVMAYRKVLGQQLEITFSQGICLDDLDIQTIDENELPPFWEEVAFGLSELKVPVDLSGRVAVPWPKGLKSPFGKKRRPRLYLFRN